MPLGRIELQDLDVLRLLLRGSSVVDWYHLHFESRADIHAFLRVNEIDPEDPLDRDRLSALRNRAVAYLGQHLRYRLADAVMHVADVETLFEYASGRGRRRHRLESCLVLKVMHILHYIEAHELLSMLPISDEEIAILTQAKIEQVVRGLLSRSFPVCDFSGNRKTSESILSKLLAKRDTQVAQLFDKLRFRFVVERREDIPPLLLALTWALVPFNYVVPAQSENSLLDLDRMLARAGNLASIRALQDDHTSLNESGPCIGGPERRNEFSGPDYKVLHFVGEVPLRIDTVMPLDPRLEPLGRVVFATVEFQIVDARTAKQNETGENRHSLYKARQLARVRERLERGKRRKAKDESEVREANASSEAGEAREAGEAGAPEGGDGATVDVDKRSN